MASARAYLNALNKLDYFKKHRKPSDAAQKGLEHV